MNTEKHGRSVEAADTQHLLQSAAEKARHPVERQLLAYIPSPGAKLDLNF